jgi:hypothetical protein
MLIFNRFASSSNLHSSVLKNQFPSSFSILCGCGCGWMTQELCISPTRSAIFKHFNPIIRNSMRESSVPILSIHVLMNLSTWYTFCPQETYHRSLLLLDAILKFHCHVHHFIATLALTARSSGLPWWLVTWHPTIPPTPTNQALSIFFKNMKVWKLFEDPLYTGCMSHIFLLYSHHSGS